MIDERNITSQKNSTVFQEHVPSFRFGCSSKPWLIRADRASTGEIMIGIL